jgi:hypothetical protein
MSKDPSFQNQLQNAGADCFVSKLAPLSHLTQAIEALRRDAVPISTQTNQRVELLTVDFRRRAIRLGSRGHSGEWKPLPPGPLVLVGYLATERANGGQTWLERLEDGTIQCTQREMWNRYAELADAKARPEELDPIQLNNMKHKVHSATQVELIEGPPPGPGTGRAGYRLVGSIAADAIDLVGLAP